MDNKKAIVDFSNEIVVNPPKRSDNDDLQQLSESQVKLKDELMSLVIQTKDEEIKLNITGDEYKKIGIHDEWRQINSSKSTYFSYQEKAVKDFIFRFTNNGILSDQVGMGKTIEAGMIISELAYKKQLGSLLIVVPNEKMAEKWESELAKKFGFRNHYKDIVFANGKEEQIISYHQLPKVYSIKNMDNLYSLIYDANDTLINKKGFTFNDKVISESEVKYKDIFSTKTINAIRNQISEMLETKTQLDSKEFKLRILREVYLPLIQKLFDEVVVSLNLGQYLSKNKYKLDSKGQFYHIVDMYLDTPINNSIYANGIIERLFDQAMISRLMVNEFDFVKTIHGQQLIEEIRVESKKATTEKKREEYVLKFSRIAEQIRKTYAVLVTSKTISHTVENKTNERFNLLDFSLNENYESEAIKYVSSSLIATKGYRVIDMLIDMSYKTLIVDEAHDFIKISHKKEMSKSITGTKDYLKRQIEGMEFTDLDLSSGNTDALKYYVFPLYNDYYFLQKESLFVEMKALADRSFRKIFMTATPIKADMVDFYLLFLLTDNNQQFSSIRNRKLITNDEVRKISSILLTNLMDSHKKALNYQTHEDIVYKYVYDLYVAMQNDLNGNFEEKIRFVVDLIIKEESVDISILRNLAVNKVRKQFQDLFTFKDQNGKDIEIHTISELVSSNKGIEQWQNVYSQIGIRSTRHQTFKLDEENLEKIKPNYRDKYQNLPIWSRRNGTIIYTYKKDHYFDQIIRKKLEEKKIKREEQEALLEDDVKYMTIDQPKEEEINKLKRELLENIDLIQQEDLTELAKAQKISSEEASFDKKREKVIRKYAPKETALDIYDYINQQLTGNLEIADYYSRSMDYDEFKLHMVASLMTNGLKLTNSEVPKKIQGKVLLFSDASTQDKVRTWLMNEISESEMSKAEVELYISKFKHEPIWFYNQNKENPSDRWYITTDIKALNDKTGNYLIIVEPDKYEEGVDLQSSDTLINFDIKFDPLKMEQRIGRIDRVKLVSKQPQLDIISFTPLNDLSGFMVDFLANELEMFSRWKGDTTGIVTFPLGEEPNSATFESAMLTINETYKALYNLNSKQFFASLKKIMQLSSLYYEDITLNIKQFLNKETQILADFDYLIQSQDAINEIVLNIDDYGSRDDKEYISFGEMGMLIPGKAMKENKISIDSNTNHTNDLAHLKKAIENYYFGNIKSIKDIIENMKSLKSSIKDDAGQIDAASGSMNNVRQSLSERLLMFEDELQTYKQSILANTKISAMAVKKQDIYEVINPIMDRYKDIIEVYLDLITNIFDEFCKGVKEKSQLMSKFISHLTIEEFKVVANNYE